MSFYLHLRTDISLLDLDPDQTEDDEWGRGAAADPVSGRGWGGPGFTFWCASGHHTRQTAAGLQCAATEGTQLALRRRNTDLICDGKLYTSAHEDASVIYV